MQIKTIKFRLDNAELFDNAVNQALEDGWVLIKREVLAPYEGETYVHHRMLYAELQKGPYVRDISQLDNMRKTVKDPDGGVWYQDADKQGWTKE